MCSETAHGFSPDTLKAIKAVEDNIKEEERLKFSWGEQFELKPWKQVVLVSVEIDALDYSKNIYCPNYLHIFSTTEILSLEDTRGL